MQRIGQKSVFLRVRSFAAFQNVEALIRHILTTQQLQLTPSRNMFITAVCVIFLFEPPTISSTHYY